MPESRPNSAALRRRRSHVQASLALVRAELQRCERERDELLLRTNAPASLEASLASQSEQRQAAICEALRALGGVVAAGRGHSIDTASSSRTVEALLTACLLYTSPSPRDS